MTPAHPGIIFGGFVRNGDAGLHEVPGMQLTTVGSGDDVWFLLVHIGSCLVSFCLFMHYEVLVLLIATPSFR